MDEYMPPSQDIAFICTVGLVLMAVADAALKVEGEQGIREHALRWSHSPELYDEMAAGAYEAAYADGRTRFVQDYEAVLSRFLTSYSFDQKVLSVVVFFNAVDVSLYRKYLFWDVMRAAYLNATRSLQWTPPNAESQDKEQMVKFYNLLTSLFSMQRGEGEK